jgi:hypothetical protein
MTRKILIAVALLATLDTANAVRVLELVERAVELSLADLTLPAPGGSTVSFAECPRCSISTHRLTDETTYVANGQTLPLVDFLRVAAEIRERPSGAESAAAAVFLDIATGRVTRIQLREQLRE